MKKGLLVLIVMCFVVSCQRSTSEDTSGKVQEAIDKIKIRVQDNLSDKKTKEE